MTKKIFLILIIIILALIPVFRFAMSDSTTGNFDLKDLFDKDQKKIITNAYPSAFKNSTLPSFDAMFDCINQFTVVTYYYISKNQTPTNLIDCSGATLTDDSLHNYSNFKKTICFDFLKNAQGDLTKIPQVCSTSDKPIIDKDYQAKYDSFIKANQNNTQNLKCSFEYFNTIQDIFKDTPYFVCNSKDYYKLITDLIKENRNTETESINANINSDDINIEMAAAGAAYETTQLKVIQKMRTFPIEAELDNYQTNLSMIQIFLQQFSKVMEAFTYIFINASATNCS